MWCWQRGEPGFGSAEHQNGVSVEKLSIDHLFPTAGLSGSLVVMRAIRRRGLPASAALEAIIIDIFSYYISFAIAAVLALIALVISYEETAVFTELFAFFVLVVVGVPLIMWAYYWPEETSQEKATGQVINRNSYREIFSVSRKC